MQSKSEILVVVRCCYLYRIIKLTSHMRNKVKCSYWSIPKPCPINDIYIVYSCQYFFPSIKLILVI